MILLFSPERQMRFRKALSAAVMLVAGCSSLQSSDNLLGFITPYRVEVVQGNVLTREQVAQVKPGMTRSQLRDVLGSPLLTDIFHGDRWDYVFTLRRRGVEAQKRHLSVFFKGDLMDRVEGDPMPSESEFVTTLDNRHKGGKVPRLEATPEELQSFQAKNPAAAAASAPAPVATAAPASTSYPPLESAPR